MARSWRARLARIGGRITPGRESAEMLYRGILQRNATPDELDRLQYEVYRHGRLDLITDAMVGSEEFSLMRLPHLMSNATVNWCGRYLFFMHVPKTAGTSVRLALTKSAGVPALTTYGHIGELQRELLPRIAFWPLFAGHGHVDYFPATHRGLTVFRESRSRIMSQYRQRQKRGDSQHLRDPRRKDVRPHADVRRLPFEQWIATNAPGSMSSHFTAGVAVRERDTHGNESPEEGRSARFVRTASPAEILAAVEAGFDRIDHAAWAHDEDAIVRAISDATGDPSPTLERLNTFEPRNYHRLEPIGPEGRRLLAELARHDAYAEDVAVQRGLIPPLARSEADALFEQTAARLGFELT